MLNCYDAYDSGSKAGYARIYNDSIRSGGFLHSHTFIGGKGHFEANTSVGELQLTD